MEIDNLSPAELTALSRQAAEVAERKAVREATAIAASVGKTLKELAAASDMVGDARPPRKVAPVYRNPSNHSQTWTGRGKQPRWFKE